MIEAIQNLPVDWNIRRLKSVATIRYGLGQPPAELEGGVPMIRATDVNAGRIIIDNLLRVDPEALPLGRNPYLKRDEIIVVRSGAYTGDSAIVPAMLEGSVAGYDMVVTANRAYPQFIAYGLLSKYVLEDQIFLLTLRAAQPHLNAEELGGITLAIPPMPEQKLIAEFLDASCAAIDGAVEAKRKQIEVLNKVKASIIHRSVTQGIDTGIETRESSVIFFNKVPKHWKCMSLKRIAKGLKTGVTPPTANPEYYENGSIEWFAPECFSKNLKLKEPKKLINELALKDGKLRLFPPQTVLFVGIGATIGKVGLLEKAGATNQQIIGIICGPKMTGRFLAYQLKNYETIIPRISQYTTLPIMNQTKVGYLPVLCPPFNEQIKICEYLDNKEREFAQLEGFLKKQISTLQRYRMSLIHECVTGQRRITETDLKKVRLGQQFR